MMIRLVTPKVSLETLDQQIRPQQVLYGTALELLGQVLLRGDIAQHYTTLPADHRGAGSRGGR